MTDKSAFGNGQDLPLVIETGGRDTRIFAELTVAAAAGVASNRHAHAELKEYSQLVDQYVQRATSNLMVVRSGAHILNTPKVLNTYVGPSAIIDSATWVQDVTMLSSPEEKAFIKAGSVVKRTVCNHT